MRGHLYDMHVVENRSCRCGAQTEDTSHFLLACPCYAVQRDLMFNTITRLSAINLDVLLFGNPMLTINDNKIIFGAVHMFIVDSNRFVHNDN